MRSIAVINQKGGVGKTTTAVNLGHALARQGRRVLLVDLDPQGHLAACLGIFRAPREGVDTLFLEGAALEAHRINTRELLGLVPAGARLGEVERPGGDARQGELLRRALASAPPDVDDLIFDCPPAAGLLVANALLAVDEVLIPVAGDYLSLTGVARLLLTIRRFGEVRASPLQQWMFLSRFVARRRLSREVQGKLQAHFPDRLLATAVSEAAALAECAGAGRTIFEYRPRSKSAAEFQALAQDFMQRRTLQHEHEETSDVA